LSNADRERLALDRRLLTRLARAHLRQGNVEQACQIGHNSLAVARASETEPSLQDLQQLRTEMRLWEHTAAVREFDAALTV
jgi:hypothetical protein